MMGEVRGIQKEDDRGPVRLLKGRSGEGNVSLRLRCVMLRFVAVSPK